MEKEKIAAMETKVRFLHKKMTSIADPSFMNNMLAHIKKPGWTSIAEGFLIEQMLHQMQTQIEELLTLKVTIDNAASLITNPNESTALEMSNCNAARAIMDSNCAELSAWFDSPPSIERTAQIKQLEQANLKLMKANPRCRLLPC